MTEIELYKLIEDNDIEWHYADNGGSEDVIIFPSFYQANQLNKMIGSGMLDEEGIECTMKEGYLAIWMNEICEYHDIELNDIFDKTKQIK